jgi:hypothetical protein
MTRLILIATVFMLVSGPVAAKEATDAIYFQCPLDLTLSAKSGVLK